MVIMAAQLHRHTHRINGSQGAHLRRAPLAVPEESLWVPFSSQLLALPLLALGIERLTLGFRNFIVVTESLFKIKINL